MTIIAPERTETQRLDALALANNVRSRRAEMKRQLTLEGAIDLVALPPWWLASMKVNEMLRHLPGWGVVRTNQMMRVCLIAAGKTVGGMTSRQRHGLIAELRDRGYVPPRFQT